MLLLINICGLQKSTLLKRLIVHFFRYDLLKKIILAFMLLMTAWIPCAYASIHLNQHQMSISIRDNRDNRNAAQLKQTIREMNIQRMKEKQTERQLERKLERQSIAEENKKEKQEKNLIEKKERFAEKINALSPEERQALRKQIKEARMEIYEKTEK